MVWSLVERRECFWLVEFPTELANLVSAATCFFSSANFSFLLACLLFERQSNREGGTDVFHLPINSPDAYNGHGWAEVRSQELHLELSCGWQGSSYLSNHMLLPRVHIGRTLDWKQRWDVSSS